MNIKEIKSQRIEAELINSRLDIRNSVKDTNVIRMKSLRGESSSMPQANRITMVENSLTFGYVHLQPNMKITLGDLKESVNVFHVVSGLGFIKTDKQIKLLSRGLKIKVDEHNKDHELVTFDDGEMTLVWWDEVADEDWFHNNLV